ncbi:MAG: peptidoglycan bridge formation glycyltransferase FemA/FemB family protein [Actinomycetes bacterium]
MQVRQISPEQHLAYITQRSSVSFLQTPAWGKAKAGWQSESLGWFENDQLVGAGLVLLRKVPKVSKYLAYLPEGPDLDWTNAPMVQSALAALVDYAKARGVFQIKMGPHTWVNRWHSETLKNVISAESAKSIAEVEPDETNNTGIALTHQLKSLGWRQRKADESGFGDYQPRYVFQISLTGKSEDDIFAEFNQQWRRNIRKAEKEGVVVRQGSEADLPEFHTCYLETAKRDHFTPRSLSYFQNMWNAMQAETPERISVFIAEHPDYSGAIAATTMTQVGSHVWYSYGASTTAARDLRPSNAVQWAMIQQALRNRASVYDMRGISDTLDSKNHLFGLIQFKLGTGGYAQEYVGEWDFVITPLWAKAFDLYMSRR